MSYTMAIIGYGGMGKWHHECVRDKVPGVIVKGAYDIRPEMQKSASENGLYSYQTIEELLQDSDIDMVTIAVPNNFHKYYSILCLQAGKHVICEKPVTLNSEELAEVIKVSEQTGKIFTVHQNRRWDKDYCIVKKILDEGIVGTPYFIETRVQGSRKASGWRTCKENGGGILYDWGAHLLDQMLELFPQKVVSVSAQLSSVVLQEVEDNVKVHFRFENGISVLMEIATNCFSHQPRWHISGSTGTAVIYDWDGKGKIVKLDENAAELEWEETIVYTSAGPTRTMAPRPLHTLQELPLPKARPRWEEFYENFVGVLDGTEELIVKPSQTLRVMRLMDTIYGLGKEGGIVRCDI